MIVESNEEISSLIKHLDDITVKFKNKHPNSLILVEIRLFYIEVVIPWMEDFMLNDNEPTDEHDEHIKNNILDIINYINNVL